MKYEDFEKQAEKIGKGNRCITKKEGKEISDARLQKENGEWFICQDLWDGWGCMDQLGYKFSWSIDEYYSKKIEYLKPSKKDLSNLEMEDILKGTVGEKRKVLGVCGLVNHMSEVDDFEKYDDGYTAEELEEDGYELVTDEVEAPETITIAGHTYIKSEVESRLKDLKEVE